MVLKPKVLLALSNSKVVTLTEVLLLRGEPPPIIPVDLVLLPPPMPFKKLDEDFFKLILLEFLKSLLLAE